MSHEKRGGIKNIFLKHFSILTLLILIVLLASGGKPLGLKEGEGYVDVPGGPYLWAFLGHDSGRGIHVYQTSQGRQEPHSRQPLPQRKTVG